MNRKKIQFGKYVAAFFITFLVFFLGTYVGNYSNAMKLNSIEDLENSIRADVIGTELQYSIARNNLCSLELDSFVEDIARVGSRLSAMESQLGFDNHAVLSLKEYYHLLEIRHFLFMKDVQRQCKKEYSLVLYFYSNAGDCEDCQEQGYLLSYINRKNPSFNTYSFDVNIDNPAVRALKQEYNVSTVPSIVINDVLYEGFQSNEALQMAIIGRIDE